MSTSAPADLVREAWRKLGWEKSTPFYVIVAFLATIPAWIVKYPPIQDLPFHLATIRVVHNFHDPAFGFAEHFQLTLGRTQYVFYYLVASALSYVVGIVGANILLMSTYLGGTVLALRQLLRALGKDERLCLLVIPLLYNVMFMFGLLPFVLGIPIMLYALATAVRYFENPSRSTGILLGVLALALFYSHVFPFGIFALGFAAMFPWSRPGTWIRAGIPVVPSILALARWTLTTGAGKLSREALTPGAQDQVLPVQQALPGVFQWLTDIFPDNNDELILIGWVAAVVLLLGLSQTDRSKSNPRAVPYVLLPLLCIALYFLMPQGHDYIWLISQRFPILFLITLIPVLRFPVGVWAAPATLALLGLGGASIVNTAQHFIRFQLEDVGDIDQAIDAIPPAQKVAALIYDKSSKVTNWVPFMHFGSYYQLRKGGVIEFTYAGYAHWPFDFLPGKYPPPGGPARKRWEWTPEQVSVQGELVPYYDYVLTRGVGFAPPPGTFHLKWRGDKWSVWQHD